jgi:alkaline phosphatase D
MPQVEVRWEIASDPEFQFLVESDQYVTGPERDYTVKVDVSALQPGTQYYYRFKALKRTSPVGKTRTLPESTDNVKLAAVSCSNYEWGYFNSYRALAEEEDIDAVLHLGDYIYEYGPGSYGDTTLGRTNIPEKEIISLEDYRTRYSQYRLDADLRAVHQNHPFINIWDDHEITNNSYKDGAQNHQPDEGDYEVRKNVAVQAYYEWLPIREDQEHYRSFDYGNLVDVIMLDERLAGRTRQPDSLGDPALTAPDHTILGEEQMNWFLDQLQNSDAKWKVIGNQVIFSYLNWGRSGFSINLDSWDGYPADQQKVVDFIRENEVENVVFLTGDTHSSWAFEVTNDPFETYNKDTGEGAVAVEFGTTSINSANSNERFPTDSVKSHEDKIVNSNINPHLKYANLRDHGYLVVEFSDDSAVATFKIVSTLRDKDFEVMIDKKLAVSAGETRLQELK